MREVIQCLETQQLKFRQHEQKMYFRHRHVYSADLLLLEIIQPPILPNSESLEETLEKMEIDKDLSKISPTEAM
jgi:hypothetical protein